MSKQRKQPRDTTRVIPTRVVIPDKGIDVTVNTLVYQGEPIPVTPMQAAQRTAWASVRLPDIRRKSRKSSDTPLLDSLIKSRVIQVLPGQSSDSYKLETAKRLREKYKNSKWFKD